MGIYGIVVVVERGVMVREGTEAVDGGRLLDKGQTPPLPFPQAIEPKCGTSIASATEKLCLGPTIRQTMSPIASSPLPQPWIVLHPSRWSIRDFQN
jgi:hypothetical protein